MPHFLQGIVLLGAPGLLLGGGAGALVPRWKPLAVLALLSAVAFWYGITHVPDDYDPDLLIVLAVVTNFGGWLVGLALGAGIVRLRRRA